MSPFAYDPHEAVAHLRRSDPVMARIVEAGGPFTMELRGDPSDPFPTLLRSILFQQLAGKAATAIERRVLALFGDRYPAPAELAAADAEALRAAGLSRQKQGYLADLALKALDGTVPFDRLAALDDDAVLQHVTKIHGVGPWTAHMLLIFSLGRPDVLPVGDYGVRKAAQTAYGLDTLPSAADLTALGEPWRPYRSVASWYLWRSLDVVAPG